MNKDEINAINKWADPNYLYIIQNNENESESNKENKYLQENNLENEDEE